MSRFRSTKRAKELSRKARHQAKEARKRERREKAQSGEIDDDIDWSQAVGFAPPSEEPPHEEDEGPQEESFPLPDYRADKDAEPEPGPNH